jgi:threonine/homoserine/homoserine lactone efflux protein
MPIFLKGLLIGFSIAAPVGPIGVLCIQRTLTYGRTSGFVTGLGAATADGVYGAIAAFGLTVISNTLVGQQFWFRLIGGVFLLYLGVRTLLAKPATDAAARGHTTLVSDYLSTFVLTLTNPMTILSFIAVFAGLGLANTPGGTAPAVMMVVGVVVGSGLWWLILSGAVGAFRDRVGGRLHLVNRLSGVIILAFGVFALAGLFRRT